MREQLRTALQEERSERGRERVLGAFWSSPAASRASGRVIELHPTSRPGLGGAGAHRSIHDPDTSLLPDLF